VHQPEAGLDLVRRQQPCPQLFQRHVRPACDLGGDGSMMLLELERLPVALRSGLGLAGGAAPTQRLVDIGDADLELPGHCLRHPATIDRRQHP